MLQRSFEISLADALRFSERNLNIGLKLLAKRRAFNECGDLLKRRLDLDKVVDLSVVPGVGLVPAWSYSIPFAFSMLLIRRRAVCAGLAV
jgi:hypothetical protein